MSDAPYRDPTAPTDARVRDLLARMTLREKAGQLNQRMYGWDAYRRTPDGGFELTDALYAETDRFEGLGALYGLQRADAWSGVDHGSGPGAEDGAELAELVQRHVVERSRLGIPALFVEEVPHGLMALDGTVLPVNLAVGAGWDPDLYERAAAHAAAELRARGGHVALVSALDIVRDPRWGRTEECLDLARDREERAAHEEDVDRADEAGQPHTGQAVHQAEVPDAQEQRHHDRLEGEHHRGDQDHPDRLPALPAGLGEHVAGGGGEHQLAGDRQGHHDQAVLDVRPHRHLVEDGPVGAQGRVVRQQGGVRAEDVLARALQGGQQLPQQRADGEAEHQEEQQIADEQLAGAAVVPPTRCQTAALGREGGRRHASSSFVRRCASRVSPSVSANRATLTAEP